jgi:protein-S-isoprenylcysteine O-methyltransferase Ste14
MSMKFEPSESGKKFEHHHSPSDGRDGPGPKLILAAILAVIIVIFIAANSKITTISFWLFTWHTTVRWSIFIAILLGIALDRLFIWGWRRRQDPKRQHDDDTPKD